MEEHERAHLPGQGPRYRFVGHGEREPGGELHADMEGDGEGGDGTWVGDMASVRGALVPPTALFLAGKSLGRGVPIATASSKLSNTI